MPRAPTDIRSLARKHTALALKTLVHIAACPTAKDSARVSAAQYLIDRGWGKAPQIITDEDGNSPAKILILRQIVDPLAIEGEAVEVVEHEMTVGPNGSTSGKLTFKKPSDST